MPPTTKLQKLCKDCQYWQAHKDHDDYAECDLLAKDENGDIIFFGVDKPLAFVFGRGLSGLMTMPDYGCMLWKKRIE